MARSSSHRTLLCIATTVALVLAGTSASAQSVVMTEAGITRSQTLRPDSENPYWISRADCLAEDTFLFPLTLTNIGSYALEVWAGSGSDDCLDKETRISNNLCWRVWSSQPTTTTTSILVPTKAIVAGPTEGTTGDQNTQYSDDVCEPEGGSTVAQSVTLYFFLVNGTDFVGSGYTWQTSYDLIGPNPPTGVSVGVGDTLLVLDWDDLKEQDLVSVRFFCDPIPGEEDLSSGGGPTDASLMAADVTIDVDLDAPASDADPDADTDADTTDAADAGDADGTSDATSSGTDSGSGGSSNSCETSVLVSGADAPPSKYQCGSGTRTSGKITGLVNGESYSVAVAGVDSVGNVGKLSKVVCESPTIVNDFYRVYRDAGGQAGGGFCNTSGGVGHGASLAGLVLVALAAAGSSLRRRRQ